jgi:hypothetical protein
MITKPTPAVLQALTNLRGQTAWLEIVKFLEDESRATDRVLAEAQEDWRLRQMQGRAQFLRELLSLAQNAPTILEKLKGSSF